MRTRTLQNRAGENLVLTELGLGGAPLGNLYRPVAEPAAMDTINAAWQAGLRVFDTAPLYGFGLSEERFGRLLPALPRDRLVVSTKIGRVLKDVDPADVPKLGFVETPARSFDFDYSYDGVMRSHEDSLRRLGLDRVDILLAHDIDIWTHGSLEASDARIRELFDQGGFRAMDELRSSGQVFAIGAGINEWEICDRLGALGDFDCFLLAGRYTLLEQEAVDTTLPMCAERDISILLGGPYNSGILATGPVEGAYYNYKPAPPAILDRVRKIEEICQAHQVKLADAALQFVFGHPVIKSVIPGAIDPDQIRANVAALDRTIPAALWQDLIAASLLREDAPLPQAQ